MGINCSTAYWGNWNNEGCQIGTRNKRFTAQFNGDGRCCVNTDVNNFSGYTGKPTFCFDNKWGQKFGAIDIPNDECRPSFEFIDKEWITKGCDPDGFKIFERQYKIVGRDGKKTLLENNVLDLSLNNLKTQLNGKFRGNVVNSLTREERVVEKQEKEYEYWFIIKAESKDCFPRWRDPEWEDKGCKKLRALTNLEIKKDSGEDDEVETITTFLKKEAEKELISLNDIKNKLDTVIKDKKITDVNKTEMDNEIEINEKEYEKKKNIKVTEAEYDEKINQVKNMSIIDYQTFRQKYIGIKIDNTIKNINNMKNEQITILTNEYEKNIKKRNQDYDNDLLKIENRYNREENDINNYYKEKSNETEKINEIKNLNQRKNNEIDTLKNEKDNKLNNLKKSFNDQKNSVSETASKEIDKIKERYNLELPTKESYVEKYSAEKNEKINKIIIDIAKDIDNLKMSRYRKINKILGTNDITKIQKIDDQFKDKNNRHIEFKKNIQINVSNELENSINGTRVFGRSVNYNKFDFERAYKYIVDKNKIYVGRTLKKKLITAVYYEVKDDDLTIYVDVADKTCNPTWADEEWSEICDIDCTTKKETAECLNDEYHNCYSNEIIDRCNPEEEIKKCEETKCREEDKECINNEKQICVKEKSSECEENDIVCHNKISDECENYNKNKCERNNVIDRCQNKIKSNCFDNILKKCTNEKICLPTDNECKQNLIAQCKTKINTSCSNKRFKCPVLNIENINDAKKFVKDYRIHIYSIYTRKIQDNGYDWNVASNYMIYHDNLEINKKLNGKVILEISSNIENKTISVKASNDECVPSWYGSWKNTGCVNKFVKKTGQNNNIELIDENICDESNNFCETKNFRSYINQINPKGIELELAYKYLIMSERLFKGSTFDSGIIVDIKPDKENPIYVTILTSDNTCSPKWQDPDWKIEECKNNYTVYKRKIDETDFEWNIVADKLIKENHLEVGEQFILDEKSDKKIGLIKQVKKINNGIFGKYIYVIVEDGGCNTKWVNNWIINSDNEFEIYQRQFETKSNDWFEVAETLITNSNLKIGEKFKGKDIIDVRTENRNELGLWIIVKVRDPYTISNFGKINYKMPSKFGPLFYFLLIILLLYITCSVSLSIIWKSRKVIYVMIIVIIIVSFIMATRK